MTAVIKHKGNTERGSCAANGGEDLGGRELNKAILRLCVPAVISNLTVPLLGLCDTTVAGHLGSPLFLSAIAVGTMMFNVVFWLLGFLRMGTTGLTAQGFGASDRTVVRAVLTEGLLLAVGIGVIIILWRAPLEKLLLHILDPAAEIAASGAQYFRIVVWGAPALLATMVITGWFLGMQNTFIPAAISISTAAINVVMSLLAVFPLGLGFPGIAAGTLTANWCGLLIGAVALLRFCRKDNERIFANLHEMRCAGIFGKFFRMNSDIFLRSACIMSVSMAVTAFGSRIGGNTLAVNAVMMQFFVLFSYFMDGFAFTGEALCGRYAGARNERMLLRSVKYLLCWSVGIAASFFLLYAGAGGWIVSFITDVPEVETEVMSYRIWLWLIPPVTVAAFIFDGFFIGLTATRKMLIATASALAVFFAIALIHPGESRQFGYPLSNNTLWLSFLSYLFVRGAVLAAWSKKVLHTPVR